MANLEVEIDGRRARRGSRVVTRSLEDIRRKARQTERSFDRQTQSMNRSSRASSNLASNLRILGGSVAFLAAGAALRGTIRAFADFEEQLIAVGKTTGIEGDNLERMGEEIQEIAGRVPLATGRLQSLAVAAGQLGVDSVEDVARFTETLGKMETATDVAGEEGARSLARLLNITGEGVSEVDRLGSSIVELGNNLATTESEIVRTSTFLGASTQQFNLTAAEVVGLSGALRAMGQRAETSGSAVGAALQEINSAISEGGNNLNTLISLTNKSGETLREEFGDSAVNVLADFAEGLSSLNAAEQARVLEDFGLAGRETSRVINALIADTDNVRKALDMANKEWENNTALNEEARLATESFNSQTQLLRNTINKLTVELGSEFAPAFANAASTIRIGLNDINDEVDELSGQNRLDFWLENLNTGMAFSADVVLGASKVIGFALETVGQAIGATAAAIVKLLAGEFQQAWEISKSFGEITFDNFDDLINSDLTVFRDALRESREEAEKLNETLGASLGVREAGASGSGSDSGSSDRDTGVVLPDDADVDRYNDMLKEGRALTEDVLTPQEQYNNEIARYFELLQGGFITQETYNRAVRQSSEDLKDALDENDRGAKFMEEVATQAARNIQTAFADFLFGPFDDGIDGMLKSFESALRRMAAEAASEQILKAIIGAFASSTTTSTSAVPFGSVSPIEAGPPQAAMGGVFNQPFIGGEAGPEAAVPLPDGRNIPVEMRGGGVVVNVNDFSDNDVEVTQGRRGGTDVIDITLRKKVQSLVDDGGIDSQMRRRFGVRPKVS